jgi:hypothetical protein
MSLVDLLLKIAFYSRLLVEKLLDKLVVLPSTVYKFGFLSSWLRNHFYRRSLFYLRLVLMRWVSHVFELKSVRTLCEVFTHHFSFIVESLCVLRCA